MLEILFLLGFVMLLGFWARWLFERTRIPAPVILMAVGLALGPLGLVQSLAPTLNVQSILPENLEGLAPIIGAVALISMLFEAGLRLKVREAAGKLTFSLLFSIANIALSIAAMAAILRYLFGMGFPDALLLSTVLGGPSALAVFLLLPLVRTSNHARTMVNLEATLSAILISIAAISMLRFWSAPIAQDALAVARELAFSLAVSLGIGVISGLLLLLMLQRVRARDSRHLLAFSAILAVFYLDFSVLGGIGVLSVAAMGLIIGNSPEVLGIFSKKREFPDDSQFTAFHGDINRFISTFFFVYLGMTASLEHLNYLNLAIALSLLGCIVLARCIVIVITNLLGRSEHHDDLLLACMMPRGLLNVSLAAFLLAYAGSFGFDFEIILLTIALSALSTSLGVWAYEKLHESSFLFRRELTLRNGHHVTIRSFTKDDFGKMRKFLNRMVRERALISLDSQLREEEESEIGADSIARMNRGDMIAWVAEYRGEIIARAVAEKMQRRERDNVSLSFYVARKFRGWGLGTEMLRMLVSKAQSTFHPKNLYLTVYSANKKAMKLYRREGFVKIGSLPGWMKHGDKYLDRVYMAYTGAGKR